MVLGKIGPHRWDWTSVGSNPFFVSHEERFSGCRARIRVLLRWRHLVGKARWKDCVDRDGVVVVFPRGLVRVVCPVRPLNGGLETASSMTRTCRLRLTNIAN